MKLLAIALYLCPLLTAAQDILTFQLQATSAFYNNQTIWVSYPPRLGDSGYFDALISRDGHIVKNGEMLVTGAFSYPFPVILSAFDSIHRRAHISSIYFIDSSVHHIAFGDLSIQQTLTSETASRANREYEQLHSLYRHLEKSDGSRPIEPQDVPEKYAILKRYIRQHPDSYVALWIVVMDYANYGYSRELPGIIDLFNPGVRNTKTGITFANNILADQSFTVGGHFPFNIFSFSSQSIRMDWQSKLPTFIPYPKTGWWITRER